MILSINSVSTDDKRRVESYIYLLIWQTKSLIWVLLDIFLTVINNFFGLCSVLFILTLLFLNYIYNYNIKV